tara:strand:+ start:261 stop:1283 length:1023 start_codon:yes stop_codon:yes gene_type:complete
MARFIKRRKKRIPLAASAARSQQDRDTFFGGKASALSGSKSTRGGRPVGRDRRSAAAVASAGAPIVASKASAAPKAEEMDDKIESTVSKLAEPAMEIPQEAKDVYEGLQDKPVEESMEMPDYAKEVYEGPAEESMEMPDYAKEVYEGAPDKPKGIIESMMGRYPKFSEAYKGMAENRALNEQLKEKYPAPPVANQSFKGMDSAGQTVLEDAPDKPKGIIESMMERFPKFAEAYKGMAENRALNEMLKKEMDRAEMSKRAADFLGFMEDKPIEAVPMPMLQQDSSFESNMPIIQREGGITIDGKTLKPVPMPTLKKAKPKSFFGNLFSRIGKDRNLSALYR